MKTDSFDYMTWLLEFSQTTYMLARGGSEQAMCQQTHSDEIFERIVSRVPTISHPDMDWNHQALNILPKSLTLGPKACCE